MPPVFSVATPSIGELPNEEVFVRVSAINIYAIPCNYEFVITRYPYRYPTGNECQHQFVNSALINAEVKTIHYERTTRYIQRQHHRRWYPFMRHRNYVIQQHNVNHCKQFTMHNLEIKKCAYCGGFESDPVSSIISNCTSLLQMASAHNLRVPQRLIQHLLPKLLQGSPILIFDGRQSHKLTPEESTMLGWSGGYSVSDLNCVDRDGA